MLENHSQHSIIGDPNSPYLTGLATCMSAVRMSWQATFPITGRRYRSHSSACARHQGEGLHVTRSHHVEVTMVEGRHLSELEALGERDHSGFPPAGSPQPAPQGPDQPRTTQRRASPVQDRPTPPRGHGSVPVQASAELPGAGRPCNAALRAPRSCTQCTDRRRDGPPCRRDDRMPGTGWARWTGPELVMRTWSGDEGPGVDRQGRAGDIARLVRGQEQQSGAYVTRFYPVDRKQAGRAGGLGEVRASRVRQVRAE